MVSGGGQLLMSHFTELAGAQLAVQSQYTGSYLLIEIFELLIRGIRRH